jgi:hypothetical protein
VGPRGILDIVVKRKIPSPRRESNPRTSIVQPVEKQVIPVLKQAPRYKDVLGSGCIAESILNIGTRWR